MWHCDTAGQDLSVSVGDNSHGIDTGTSITIGGIGSMFKEIKTEAVTVTECEQGRVWANVRILDLRSDESKTFEVIADDVEKVGYKAIIMGGYEVDDIDHLRIVTEIIDYLPEKSEASEPARVYIERP